MNEISTILIEQINRAGPIRISDYMEICLMHPKCGYYSKKDPFGTKGDFVTSPEISQVFGELLGLCLAQNWLDQGTPSFALVEAGPGRGTLMADILRATKSIPGFHQSMTIHLIEKSQTLIRIQGEHLSKYNVEWHETVESLPQKPVFFIANEFFDALPIRQFRKDNLGWREILIGIEKNKLSYFLGNKIPLHTIAHRIKDTEIGDIVEICEAAKPIMEELSKRIKMFGGCAIIIDYGSNNLVGNTFQAVKNHKKIDPLKHPGDCDLTAHVNFNDLSNYATNVVVAKTTTQGLLLRKLGISERFERLATDLPKIQKLKLRSDKTRLIHSSQMGDLFKAIALVPSKVALPIGFDI